MVVCQPWNPISPVQLGLILLPHTHTYPGLGKVIKLVSECALPFKSKPRVFTKRTGPGERKIVFILYKEKGRLEGLEA